MIISGPGRLHEQPKEVTIQSEDVRAALQAPIEERWCCTSRTPSRRPTPDLASDIIQNGILLTGGGGLPGLDRYLTDKLEIPVVSETALTNVVSGCLKVLETPTALKQTPCALEVGLSLPRWLSTFSNTNRPPRAGSRSLSRWRSR